MRSLISLLALLALSMTSGCMKVSDLADGAEYQLRDVGVLDHAQTQRANSRRIQQDSFIYIAQGYFKPRGEANPTANVVAEEAFKGFIEYFPLVRKSRTPLGLEQAMSQARADGAHYLLYCRFATADDRIGTVEEWEDQEALDRLGPDSGVIQLMVIETSTRYLVDTARIRLRGGLLTTYDTKPEDLIGPPLEQYARSLIGLSN